MKGVCVCGLAAGLCCFLLGAATLARGGDCELVALIKELSSSNFRQRQAASEALKRRPDAIPALREAARSSDAETSRRIATILDYHDREPVRRLEAAAEEGRVEDFIRILGEWPTGIFDADAFRQFCGLAVKLAELYEKKGGAEVKFLRGQLPGAGSPDWFEPGFAIPAFVAARVTEVTKAPKLDGHDLAMSGLFFRVGEVDVDRKRCKEEEYNGANGCHFILASRSARFSPYHSQAVFVGGPLDLLPIDAARVPRATNRHSVFVCCGDAHLNCRVDHCLIIARGNIVCNSDHVENSGFISGKSVSIAGTMPKNCKITENESNPLGFIRWAEVSKEKAPAKRK